MELLKLLLKFIAFKPKCKTCKFWKRLENVRRKSRFGKCEKHSTVVTLEYYDKDDYCREHEKEDEK